MEGHGNVTLVESLEEFNLLIQTAEDKLVSQTQPQKRILAFPPPPQGTNLIPSHYSVR